MKERPIIFSAPMVRAILAGTKTQTRRVVKPQPPEALPAYAPKVYWPARDRHMTCNDLDGAAYLQLERPSDYDGAHVMRGGFGFRCCYGQPGNRLWVRESFRDARAAMLGRVLYRADGENICGWKPSIHMPRHLSRITLEVTDVRVERLQDISVADAMAEGVVECNENLRGLEPCMEWRYAYEDLWDSINGPGSWDANPWVWVIEFKRVTP